MVVTGFLAHPDSDPSVMPGASPRRRPDWIVMPLADPRAGDPLEFHTYTRNSGEFTIADPETILWASIRHFCSRNVATWMARNRFGISNKSDRARLARNVSLYVQQASEFYYAAA